MAGGRLLKIMSLRRANISDEDWTAELMQAVISSSAIEGVRISPQELIRPGQTGYLSQDAKFQRKSGRQGREIKKCL